MQYRAIIFASFAIIAVVAAGKKHHDDSHVGYKFGYSVHDPHTHDIKSHHEERHGKHVVGYYSLKQPDGTTRIVHYKAGPHSGFEAKVEIVGHPHHHSHHGHGNKKGHGSHKGHGNHQNDGHGNNGNGHGYAVHEDADMARYLGAKHHENQEEEEDGDDEY